LIKGSLRIWHQNHTQNLDDRISELQDHISSLADEGDEYDLDLKEVEELHFPSANFHYLSRINNNIQ